ncbi:malto-oligosyltrehalose trehalohydrolase [soil metagenome]
MTAPLGATALGKATTFAVWAPRAKTVELRIVDRASTTLATHPLTNDGGTWHARVEGVGAGTLYHFVVDGQTLPDPRAQFLPFGVHGPAEVRGPLAPLQNPIHEPRPLNEQILYELHVGTFTREGTFASAAEKIGEIAALGVTTIELMPVSAFDGTRGWGYDGVAFFAPFAGYGTPDDLRSFIDIAHGYGLAVLLDAVYNHLGPSGNYLSAFDPAYFTAAVDTGWGDAPDFSHGPMRALVIDSVRHWLDYGFDGLRLDATHAIVDASEVHVVAEMTAIAAAMSPRRIVMVEDERNHSGVITEWHADAVWADDFHHTLHVALTGEHDGYYSAYTGSADEIAKTITRGWLYEGEIYAPTGKSRGGSAAIIEASRLVYCLQNHDQVGNRALGDRLGALVSAHAYDAVTMLLLFLPMTPLLFMGQEWRSTTPFFYFTDHAPELGAKISEGRRREFAHFSAFRDEGARSAIPDPQARVTFERSRLDIAEATLESHQATRELHRRAIALRREDAVLSQSHHRPTATARGDVVVVRQEEGPEARYLVVNFGKTAVSLPEHAKDAVLLASRDDAWADGKLASEAAVIFAR